MNEYFFANYRLLTDDGIANHEFTKRLVGFRCPHTLHPYLHPAAGRRRGGGGKTHVGAGQSRCLRLKLQTDIAEEYRAK